MITAAGNQKIKRLTGLFKKRRERSKQDLFVAEGIKMFMEADPKRLHEVYVSKTFYEGLEKNGEVEKKLLTCKREILSDSLFEKVSDTQTPQGILSVIRQYHYRAEELLKRKNPLLLLIEDIQDPGNLGTLFRTAEGAGADGVIMSRKTVDIYNPKTIRSTMGSIYRMPFFYTEDLLETMAWLNREGVTVYAAHLQGKKAYYEECFEKGTAFLIGNEARGLKEETAQGASTLIKIPMEGKVESLNASVAASILLYEAVRQRKK